MDVLSIINAVAETGFMVVAAGIVLWLYIKNDKDRTKREEESRKDREKMVEEQEEKYSELFKYIIEQIKQTACNPTHTPQEDAVQEKINNRINEVLKNLRDATGAARAVLVRYHNGTYDLVGNSAIKMSITNEADALGIEPLQPQFQNQFKGFLSYWCAEIRDKGYCYINDLEVLLASKEYTMYEFLVSRGIVNSFGRAVYNNQKQVIGFIAIEYFTDDHVGLDRLESCLIDKANKISTLLSIDTPKS